MPCRSSCCLFFRSPNSTRRPWYVGYLGL
ncbi:(2Fe-2S)-binding protein [Alcaligenes faecalis]